MDQVALHLTERERRDGDALDLSIVIPVYNSSATLRELVDRLLHVLPATGRHEIVFVDDGSMDDSWSILCELRDRYPELVVVVQLMRNYGQHNALMCGFRHAQGEIIVTMDDDLQNPPEEIPKLLDAIQHADLDLVYGVYESKKHRRWRNMGSSLVLLFYRTVFKSDVTVTSFRAIRRRLLNSIFTYNLNFTFVDGLLAWNTQRVGTITVDHHPRLVGRSGYSLKKLALLGLNLFTNFSLLPLQLVSACGFFAAIAGFLTGIYFLIKYLLSGIAVPGFASTIIAILVLGGVQLLALGVIGEYLGRLHLNVNRKPQYTERQVLDRRGPATPTAKSDEEIYRTPASQQRS